MNAPAQQQATAPLKQKTRRTRQPKDPQISVARRNERERNRVKMVNNAFANLREHLPDELVERLVCDSKGKGKKFSKVETLRTAIQHIKNLVEVLNGDPSAYMVVDQQDNTSQMYSQQQQQQQLSPISVYSQQQYTTATAHLGHESPIFTQHQQQMTPESPIYCSTTQQLTPASPPASASYPTQACSPTNSIVYTHSPQQTIYTTSAIQPGSPHDEQQQNSNWTYSQQQQETVATIKQEQVMSPAWFPSPASSSSTIVSPPVSASEQQQQLGYQLQLQQQPQQQQEFVPLHHAYQHHQISLYSQ